MLIGKKGESKTAIETSDASSITIRGKDLCNDLMGNMSISEFFYFHLTGSEPNDNQKFFLDLLIIALAEHGLVPSVQAARMTLAAAPEALQGAVAAGILGVGSVILGSAEQCVEMLERTKLLIKNKGYSAKEAATSVGHEYKNSGKFLPGFGHPIHHPIDPRAERVLQLADERKASGLYVSLLKEFPYVVEEVWGKPLPMNLTGPMAAILLDLEVPKGAVRGIPILARTLGLIGHLNEEQNRPIGFLMSHYGSKPIEYDGE
ncbi:MAG: citryl-CoA lyase [Alphaproteobacteria bacterium]|mgnify:FL=1|nr:citryl-CoA lyase [Alphaproteobacteria bacterium]|tara:strand:+ start:214 stop:996 length:783 start_codon:yes stop_codon:yes gene_type:complete